MPERDLNSEVVKTWREKLAYLQKQEAITADPAQKFALSHQIEEAQSKIAELTQVLQRPSGEAEHLNKDVAPISHDHLVYSLPPEQKPEADTRRLYDTEGNKTRLVILLHGIRTRAEWQGRLRFLFEATGETVVEPLGYGYFDVFRFLIPFWTRRAPIKEVLRKIRDTLSQHRDEHREIIFVAHSFGTFILTKVLRENPDIRPDRMLLCGSVVERTFLWDTLPNRPKIVINEVGSRDIWPILAKSITWGYGSTGTFGFQTPGVRDRYHNLAHSDYFKGDFAERFWVPWIRFGQVKPTPFDTGHAPPTPFWKNLFEVLPLKWVGLLVMALILVSYLTHPALHIWGFLK